MKETGKNSFVEEVLVGIVLAALALQLPQTIPAFASELCFPAGS